MSKNTFDVQSKVLEGISLRLREDYETLEAVVPSYVFPQVRRVVVREVNSPEYTMYYTDDESKSKWVKLEKINKDDEEYNNSCGFTVEKTVNIPDSIGYLCITDNFKVSVHKPISRFHKLMMKVFFGWKWEGAENDKSSK